MHCQFVSLAGDVFEEFRVTAGRLCLLASIWSFGFWQDFWYSLCLFGCKKPRCLRMIFQHFDPQFKLLWVWRMNCEGMHFVVCSCRLAYQLVCNQQPDAYNHRCELWVFHWPWQWILVIIIKCKLLIIKPPIWSVSHPPARLDFLFVAMHMLRNVGRWYPMRRKRSQPETGTLNEILRDWCSPCNVTAFRAGSRYAMNVEKIYNIFCMLSTFLCASLCRNVLEI